MALLVSSRSVISVGAVFTAVLPLSTDIMVVTLPIIAMFFGPEVGGHQVMSAFVLGLAVAHLFVGALADRFGRRPVAIVGFGIYALASFGAMFAETFEALLIARFIQGISGASGPILMRAMIRDTVPPTMAPARLALVGSLSGLAPLFAPTLGVTLGSAFGWQAAFGVLTLYGVFTFALILLIMPETLAAPTERVHLIRPASLKVLLTDRNFLIGSLALATGYGGLLCWLSTGGVFLTGLGIDPLVVSLVYAAGSVFFMSSGILSMRLGLPPHRLIAAGAISCLVGGIGALLIWLIMPDEIWFCLPVMLFYAGWNMVQPSAIFIAMRHHPAIAGQASALLGLIQLSGGVVISNLVVALGAGANSLALMAVSGLVILLATKSVGAKSVLASGG